MKGLWSPTESEASDADASAKDPSALDPQNKGAKKFKFFAATNRMRILNNPNKLVSLPNPKCHDYTERCCHSIARF